MKAEAENWKKNTEIDPRRAEFIKDMDYKVKQILLNQKVTLAKLWYYVL